MATKATLEQRITELEAELEAAIEAHAINAKTFKGMQEDINELTTKLIRANDALVKTVLEYK